MVVPQKISYMELLNEPVILLLGIYPKVIGGIRTDVCTPKSIAAVYTVVKSTNNPKSIHDQMNKQNMVHSYNGMLFGPKREGSSDTYTTTRMDPENIITE